MPTLPEPLGTIEKCWLETVVISVSNPEKVKLPSMVIAPIVPPLTSMVVTVPKSVQVAPAAVGEVVMVGEVKDLLDKVSDPARVARVPVVGKVRLVVPVEVRVIA